MGAENITENEGFNVETWNENLIQMEGKYTHIYGEVMSQYSTKWDARLI